MAVWCGFLLSAGLYHVLISIMLLSIVLISTPRRDWVLNPPLTNTTATIVFTNRRNLHTLNTILFVHVRDYLNNIKYLHILIWMWRICHQNWKTGHISVRGYSWLPACIKLLRLRAVIYLEVGKYLGRIGIYFYSGLAIWGSFLTELTKLLS